MKNILIYLKCAFLSAAIGFISYGIHNGLFWDIMIGAVCCGLYTGIEHFILNKVDIMTKEEKELSLKDIDPDKTGALGNYCDALHRYQAANPINNPMTGIDEEMAKPEYDLFCYVDNGYCDKIFKGDRCKKCPKPNYEPFKD